MKIVYDKIPTKENARNGEGAFITVESGRILFAYSRFCSADANDDAVCDINCIYSDDEGETWQELGIIAKAADFGVGNVMSVSSMKLTNGDAAFFFLIKENDGTSTIGRTVTKDGVHFSAERCICDFDEGYYVINNGRAVRFSDGTIVLPAAHHAFKTGEGDGSRTEMEENSTIHLFFSDDNGKRFYDSGIKIELSQKYRLVGTIQQEPGIVELSDGRFFLWARTNAGTQFVSVGESKVGPFTEMKPSEFFSPCSPLSVLIDGQTLYAVHNPNPAPRHIPYSWGRTQLVLRKSENGNLFGEPLYLETALDMGFCYPSLMKTKDDSLLISYSCGGEKEGCCLNRFKIIKIKTSEI